MRIMNAGDRLALLTPGGLRDVAELSHGAFGPNIQAVYDRWAQFTAWARQHATHGPRDDLPLPRVQHHRGRDDATWAERHSGRAHGFREQVHRVSVAEDQ